MKDQASLNLKIVDTPITKNALDGHLMLSATSTGLKLYDHTGAETPICRVVASATEPENPTEGMIWIETE